MIYLQLFWEFFKTGLFAIGGGLATLPFLQEMGEKMGWFTMEDLSNVIAISESTPGPLGVNMATYTGNITGGVLGGIIATVGLVTPSVIIIVIIAKFLAGFKDNVYVNNVLSGIRPASTALIAVAMCSVGQVALLNMGGENIFKFKEIIMALLLIVAIKKFKLHPVVYIATAAVLGIVLAL